MKPFHFVLLCLAGWINRKQHVVMVLFSEGSLRYVIGEYMEHYHLERNHQGLDSRIIYPEFEVGAGDIEQHEHVGGLLNFYCREAA